VPNDASLIVYLEYRPVPATLGPCYVDRGKRVALLYVDPDVSCVEAATWVVENMTLEEQNYIRAAYGVPPVGQGGEPRWVSDSPIRDLAWVPEVLCPPDAMWAVSAQAG
jgi:hypothetical protein